MSEVKGKFQVGEELDIDKALGGVKTSAGQERAEQPKEVQEVKETQEPIKQKTLDEVIEEQSQIAKPEVDENIEKILGNKVEPKEVKQETKQPEPKQPEINDDVLLNYLNAKNNTSFKSLEEYQASLVKVQEKEVEKVVDPYEGILDDADKEYLEFKKSTGGNYNDFLNSKKDWDSVPDLALARERVKKENGLDNLSDEEADLLLASSLGLEDLEDLDGVDAIKFKAYASKYRKELKEAQKEQLSKKPVKEVRQPEQAQQEEMVTLDNGQTMPKAQYDQLVQQRNDYLKAAKEAVDSIADFEFSFNISENGETKTLNYKYNVSEEDRHSMMSIHENGLNVFIDKEFTDKDGNFNHAKLSRAMYFAKESNLQKVIKAVSEQVRAETVEELLGERNNVNFSGKKLKEKTPASDLESKLLGGQVANVFGVRGTL